MRNSRARRLSEHMDIVRRRPQGRYAASRGATYIELALTLPLFFIMILLTFDVGRMVTAGFVATDLAFTTARTAAQTGGAGINSIGTAQVCPDYATGCTSSRAANYFTSQLAAVDTLPGLTGVTFDPSITIERGAVCGTDESDAIVRVVVGYELDVTFAPLLGLAPDTMLSGSGIGVARCEIVLDSVAELPAG